jgi:hypothetical protein
LQRKFEMRVLNRYVNLNGVDVQEWPMYVEIAGG